MNWMCEYVSRVISGAVLSAILLSIPLQQSAKKVLTAACGCFMILISVSPLYQADLNAFSFQFPDISGVQTGVEAGDNSELLQQLICAQTEELIKTKALEFDIIAEASVTLRYDTQIGSYLPDAVTVTVSGSKGTLTALQEFITSDLAIPKERQQWILN